MAKFRRGCRRIFLIFVSLFVCAIISTIFNAWMKPQVDATRTAEAGIGQTAIAANMATASIIALTPSNTPTVTFTPSATAIAKRQAIATNTAITVKQATDSIAVVTPTTSTRIPPVVITVTNPPTVMLDPTDAQVQTVVAMSQATAAIIALTPTTSAPTQMPIPTSTSTVTSVPFSDTAYIAKLRPLFDATGLDIRTVYVADGRAKGGTRGIILTYVSYAKQETEWPHEWALLFASATVAIENYNLDLDEFGIIIGLPNGDATAMVVVQINDLLAYRRNEIDTEELFKRLQLTDF